MPSDFSHLTNENVIFSPRSQDYLTHVDPISDANRRSIMRQIKKLAKGEGIRYESKEYGWPE